MPSNKDKNIFILQDTMSLLQQLVQVQHFYDKTLMNFLQRGFYYSVSEQCQNILLIRFLLIIKVKILSNIKRNLNSSISLKINENRENIEKIPLPVSIRLEANSGIYINQTFSYRLDAKKLQMSTT